MPRTSLQKRSYPPGAYLTQSERDHKRIARKTAALIRETIQEWSNDNVPRLGASLAFYTMLSLAPLLVIVIAVAALVYGREAAQGTLFWQIQGWVGPESALLVQTLLNGASQLGAGLIATALGTIVLICGASSVVVDLRESLNTIWGRPPSAALSIYSSIILILKERFYAVALVLAVGCLLLLSLAGNAAFTAIGNLFASWIPPSRLSQELSAFFFSFVITIGLFAAIYKTLPDVELEWADVFFGAVITSLLFTIGKHLLRWYLARASFSSTYGAAGSFVVVIVWVYYSAQLFFFGAEMTKVYTRTYGSHHRSPSSQTTHSAVQPAISNSMQVSPGRMESSDLETPDS